MKTIQNAASGFFILAVAVLSLISILGIWDFFSKDVILKSFQTLGLLAVISIVVIVAGRFIGNSANETIIEVPNPIFNIIRRATLGILIVAAVLLAFLGICAIWEVITDKEVLYKSLSSLAILAFSAFIIVITCMEREKSAELKGDIKGGSGARGILSLIAVVFVIWLIISAFSF